MISAFSEMRITAFAIKKNEKMFVRKVLSMAPGIFGCFLVDAAPRRCYEDIYLAERARRLFHRCLATLAPISPAMSNIVPAFSTSRWSPWHLCVRSKPTATPHLPWQTEPQRHVRYRCPHRNDRYFTSHFSRRIIACAKLRASASCMRGPSPSLCCGVGFFSFGTAKNHRLSTKHHRSAKLIQVQEK